MEERSLGGGGGERNDIVRVNGKRVNFYKLDKTKPYRVEGGAQSAIAALFSRSAREKRRLVGQAVAEGTLTDGTVAEIDSRRVVSGSGSSKSESYEVKLTYTFFDKEGTARVGILETVYNSEPPFFKGQNLMVCFNSETSAILSKFTLAEGAKEFYEAEDKRLAVDFDCLSGKLLNAKPDKKVKTMAYSGVWVVAGACLAGFWLIAMIPVTAVAVAENWGMPFVFLPVAVTSVFFLLPAIYMIVLGLKRKLRLKKILKNPSFTKGILYLRKSTYRGGDKVVFYRFKDADGGCHIEKFKGVTPSRIVDGQVVTVVYSGKRSEVVTGVTVRNRKN